jgi:ABC-type dipeptide/oligopeptide/nickel transport system permease subunit
MSSVVLDKPGTVRADDAQPVARNRPVLLRVVRRPLGAAALSILLLLVVATIAAPLIARYSPNHIVATNTFRGPSGKHWFGTDDLGRDMFSRVLYGGRISLGIALGATVVAMLIGVAWGFAAGQARGLLDEVLMRGVDVIMSIPVIMFSLILVVAFGSRLSTLAIIIGLLLSPVTARVARAAVLTELRSDYYRAAVAVGASRLRVIFGEVLPNTAPVLIARAAIVAADAIIVEASLSFIGLGVQPPSASWGTLMQQGYQQIFRTLWYITFPGAFIFLAIWSLNTVGDQLQETLDPRGLR